MDALLPRRHSLAAAVSFFRNSIATACIRVLQATVRSDAVAALPFYPACTENLIRVDDVMESPKLAE
jgi:hypothetical protein